jgi:phage shock protein A
VVAQSSTAVASLSGLDAGSELDRMESRIRATESEALAYQEIDSGSFDAQFRELDYDVEIEQQLEALKGGSSVPAGALPSGDEEDSPSENQA